MSQSTAATAGSSARGASSGPADVAALLARIDERLARVERALDRAESVAAGAPGLVATVTDTLDGLAARAAADGVNVDERMRGVVRLLERLTDPRTERALERLLEAAPLLEKAVGVAEQVPGLVATALDTADSLAARAKTSGIDVEERMRIVARVLERLTAPEALAAVETLLGKVDALKAVLASGVLDPRALATVATAGDALAKAANASSSRMSLWGAFRAASDPEVQTALAFLVRFAHAFGQDLHEAPPDRRLVASTIT